jgi:hypothetical protein
MVQRKSRGLEPFPFRLNRNGALVFCFDAFSLREPVSTSLENALARHARSQHSAAQISLGALAPIDRHHCSPQRPGTLAGFLESGRGCGKRGA